MSNTPGRKDSTRLIGLLDRLPEFESHFAWGPINSVVFLLGLGVTTALLHSASALPGDDAVAIGIAAIFLLAVVQLCRRWDAVLGSLLIVAVAFSLHFESYDPVPLMFGLGFAVVLATTFQVLSQWDKTILLRLGRFRGVRGPGLFFIAPFIDRLEVFVDQRVRATDFRAERILTLDTVPVYVDAICFWLVWSAEKAVLEVEHYAEAVILSAQTALKDAVGRH